MNDKTYQLGASSSTVKWAATPHYDAWGYDIPQEHDPVNSPRHYNLNHKGIECIQAIEAALTKEEFRGFLKGNVLKYTWREKYKNGLQDNEKAVWYANKLVEATKNEPKNPV